jgi:hypothetical protein
MKPETNAPIDRAAPRAQRRLIEDIWKFERKWLNPRMPKPARVLVPVRDDSGFANTYPEETFQEINMDGADDNGLQDSKLSKVQFIAIVAVLMVLAFAAAYLMTFIDIKTLPQNIIKRLY